MPAALKILFAYCYLCDDRGDDRNCCVCCCWGGLMVSLAVELLPSEDEMRLRRSRCWLLLFGDGSFLRMMYLVEREMP